MFFFYSSGQQRRSMAQKNKLFQALAAQTIGNCWFWLIVGFSMAFVEHIKNIEYHQPYPLSMPHPKTHLHMWARSTVCKHSFHLDVICTITWLYIELSAFWHASEELRQNTCCLTWALQSTHTKEHLGLMCSFIRAICLKDRDVNFFYSCLSQGRNESDDS